jgi:hypothetical protein
MSWLTVPKANNEDMRIKVDRMPPSHEKSRLVVKVYKVNPTTMTVVRKNAFTTMSKSYIETMF